MRRMAWLCGALACIPILPAQQRAPTFFTVVDAEGKPLASATVTCAFEPTTLTPATRDLVTATTDARGLARADLAPERLYTAWAIGTAAADGAALASDCIELVIAGQVRELTALDRCTPRQVPVEGMDAWRKLGGKALRWMPVRGFEVAVELPWPTADTVQLPPSPQVAGTLAILGEGDAPLVVTTIQPEATSASFEAPVEVLCVALDEHGDPVAGAEIARPRGSRRADALFPATSLESAWRGAVTGADGSCTLHLTMPARSLPGRPVPGLPPQLLYAGAPGRQWTATAVNGDGPLEFKLAPAGRRSIAVRGAANAASELTANGTFSVRIDRGTRGGSHDLRATREADDRWTIEHGDAAFTLRLSAPQCVPILTLVPGPPAATPVEIDTGAWAPIDAVVKDAEGSPQPAAVAVGQTSRGRTSWVWLTATDVAGRSRIRIPQGDYVLYATTGTHHALALVDRSLAAPHELRLAAIPTMRVRVTDAAGKPVAGARAEPSQYSNGRPAGEPLEQAWQSAAVDLHHRYAGTTRSDHDGVLRVPAFVLGMMSSKVVVRAGASRCAPIALVPGGEVEVVLQQ